MRICIVVLHAKPSFQTGAGWEKPLIPVRQALLSLDKKF